MKKITIYTYIMLVFFWAISFDVSSQNEKLTIVSSASIFQDMAKQLGGDRVESFSIVPIGGDPHLYEPKPSDAQLVKRADIILVNGLTFEGWITKLINNSGTNAIVSTITEGITPIKSEKYHNAADPHAWMDANNGLTYIENIKNALVEIDPANEDYYLERYEKYKDEIIAMDQYIKKEILKIPEPMRMIVTSHDAFAYYGKRYGMRLNALKGISTEAETQTKDMVRVARSIRESGVPAIFVESTINPKVIQQIAEDNNVKIGGELYADSIGDQDSDAPTYLDMLRHNTDVIVKALSLSTMSNTKIDDEKQGNPWLVYGIMGFVMLGAFLLLISKFNK